MIRAANSAAIVLAAGSASRFGSPKALAPLAGRPILQHVLDAAAQFDFGGVVVVLGHNADEIEGRLRWRSECRVRNPDPEAGLSSSLRVGLDALDQLDPGLEAALIMLGDQPMVRAEVMEALLAQLEFEQAREAKPIVAPRYGDGGGPNPLLILRPAWPLAREARADRGLGPVIREHSDLVRWVDVHGSNPDVDTQADLDALEAQSFGPIGPQPREGRQIVSGHNLGRAPQAVPPLVPIHQGFQEMASPSDALSIPSLPNLRDVGGLRTADGRRVRTGLLYRSGALDLLDDQDASKLARLGIKTIYDLRSDVEKQARPDRILSGVEYVGLDMINGPAQHTPGRIMNSLKDPSAAREAFGDGRGVAMFLSHYREFVALPSARRALARVFTDVADERHLPALVHCMGGKDRTGWTAASLQLLLGVPDDAVMAHFLASNDHLRTSFNGFMTDFVARGGEAEVIAEFLWSRPEYLEASLAQMRASFGTIERYFSDGLGLGAETIAALRARFIED